MSASETITVQLSDIVAPVTTAAEAHAKQSGRPTLACVGIPVRFDDPLALLHASAPDTAGWWATAGLRAAGAEIAALAEAQGADRFASLADALDRWFDGAAIEGRAPIAFVGGAYADVQPTSPWDGFASAAAWIPELCAIRDDEGTWLVASTLVFDGDAARAADHLVTVLARGADDVSRSMGDIVIRAHDDGHTPKDLTPDEDDWTIAVSAVLEAIDGGQVDKVVLARRWERTLDEGEEVQPWTVAARMSAAYPECFSYGVRFQGRGTFVGASPELLIARDGDTVRSAPAAGTVARGASGLTSDKSHREQQIVADAVKSTLEAFCDEVRAGSAISTAAGPVEHLSTSIEGTLSEPTHVTTLVGALHPTPAVGGMPQLEAQALQRSSEGFDRGWYAGPIGIVTPSGDGCFAIALRGALLHPTSIDLYAGAGIVAGSDPDAERDEISLKLSAAAAALPA